MRLCENMYGKEETWYGNVELRVYVCCSELNSLYSLRTFMH